MHIIPKINPSRLDRHPEIFTKNHQYPSIFSQKAQKTRFFAKNAKNNSSQLVITLGNEACPSPYICMSDVQIRHQWIGGDRDY